VYEDVLKFGWIIIADNGYCTNKYRFPLFNAVTQDNFNRTIQVMKGWVTNERFVTFDVIYSTAFRALYPQDFLERVRLFVVDGDGQQLRAIRVAIASVFINAKLASCLVHLIQKPLATLSANNDESPKAKAKRTITALLWAAARNARTKEHFLAMLTLAEHALFQVKEEKSFVEGAQDLLRSLLACSSLWANSEFRNDYCRIKGRTSNPAEGMNNVDNKSINSRFNLANAAGMVAAYSVTRHRDLDVERERASHATTALSADSFVESAPSIFTPYAVQKLAQCAAYGRRCEVLRVEAPGRNVCLAARLSQLLPYPHPIYPPAVYDAAEAALDSDEDKHVCAAQTIMRTNETPRHMLWVERKDDGRLILCCSCNRFRREGFLCWGQTAVLLDFDPNLRARAGDAIEMFHKDYSDPARAFIGGVVFPGDNFEGYAASKELLSRTSPNKRELERASVVQFDPERKSPASKSARSRITDDDGVSCDAVQDRWEKKSFLQSSLFGVAKELEAKDAEGDPEFDALYEDALLLTERFHVLFDRSDTINETSSGRHFDARDWQKRRDKMRRRALKN
jgi:hypothetical protein